MAHSSSQVGRCPAGAAQCAGHCRQLAAAHPRPARCVVERPQKDRLPNWLPAHPRWCIPACGGSKRPGSDAALQAAGHRVKEKPPPDMPNEKKVVMLLDEVKKRGEELINKRDADATKEMIAAIQNLVLKVGPKQRQRVGGG